MPAVTVRDKQLEDELDDAEDAANNGRADELNTLRLLRIADEFRKALKTDEAKRAESLASRSVWAGACEEAPQ